MEIWKDVIGYEGLYQVSSEGRVKSLPRRVGARGGKTRLIKGKILKPKINKGYERVQFGRKGGQYSVHRLVAQAFIANPDDLPQVNHLNHNRLDNRVENLVWGDAMSNKWHDINSGNKYRRELTDEQVLEIRNLLETGVNRNKIAEMYGICRSSVQNIRSGKTYWYL